MVMDAPPELAALKTRLQQVADLGWANALLQWDQATYMPPGGAAARGRQMATLGRISHEMATEAEIGRLLDALTPYAESLPWDDDTAALIRVAQYDYDQMTRIPAALMARFYAHTAEIYQVWTEARPANDFKRVMPLLEKTLDLSREVASCFPYEHIADPLIDNADRGMKAESIRALFAELRAELIPLVAAIAEAEPIDASVLHQHYPVDKQRAFGEMVIRSYGYDFNRGRQDTTHHPFMARFGAGDVRITTRFNENDLGDGLFSTLHECGHALYEMGVNDAYDGTPLLGGASAGVHESQSRTWENLVGRSLPFWRYYYPQLQQTFPEQLGNVPLEVFYRAINSVKRSLIRVDADEVTYNLHVMIRFDLELALLEGSLAVRDLPEAWNARYESDLGIRPPDDRDGVLQDVHWYSGTIGGMFQGYTLGNIMSGLFWSAALQAHPEIPAEIEAGGFGVLHGWLKENIYRHGRKYTPDELVQQVTGSPLTIAPYMAYLHDKYSALYELG